VHLLLVARCGSRLRLPFGACEAGEPRTSALARRVADEAGALRASLDALDERLA
jgi:hypothetical protein